MLELERTLGQRSPGGLTTCARVSPDGRYVAVADRTAICVYSVGDGGCARYETTHTEPINDICWSPDSACVASGSEDFTVEITHLEYGRLHKLRGHSAPVLSVVFNCKGNLLCTASVDESIKQWDVLSGTLLKTMSAHSDPVVSIDTPDCDATILSSGSYDGLIRIFDTESGHCLKTLTYDKDWQTDDGVVPISQVKFSRNGKFLLVRSLDGVVKLWDFIRGCVVRTFKDASGESRMKYSCGMDFLYPDSEAADVMVVVGGEDGNICVWNAQSKAVAQTLKGQHEDSPVIAVSCKETLVCTLSLNGICHLWRWVDGISDVT
ncbi:AGR207Cp [Eremothecium gossypii ATCC 10895]|uniref:AGR207Cp n=1 Tax=Eremothecium gossypii (strain ATCC 10895 / CBS 109.51 / FGSC 9923 / NRRL Y-1056) TaxID=284811 RepID=Q74ZW2_EREGS|nr:AGR207Cp [Eremothecium gossypii ATCC 10895]AAS54697.1 AGR207Cp [Eremothecium gossypii ATCC 10895]AEY99027.1 FAGR207Cp [Eremothecium gossypii FDAG1]